MRNILHSVTTATVLLIRLELILCPITTTPIVTYTLFPVKFSRFRDYKEGDIELHVATTRGETFTTAYRSLT